MRKFVRLSLLLSLAIVLNIIETSIPFFGGQIPGLKLGLANIVTLFVLYKFSFKDALYVGILRVFLVGMLRTGLFSTTFLFSLTGVIISIVMMFLFKRFFSIVGVSIIGAISHSVGQLVMALVLINTNMFYYLPVFIVVSIITGTVIGILCKHLLEHFESDLIYEEL